MQGEVGWLDSDAGTKLKACVTAKCHGYASDKPTSDDNSSHGSSPALKVLVQTIF